MEELNIVVVSLEETVKNLPTVANQLLQKKPDYDNSTQNSVPASPALLTNQQEDNMKTKIKYAKFLQDTVKEMANEVQCRTTTREPHHLDQFLDKVRTRDEILEFAKLFNDQHTLRNITRPRLVNMCNCMGIQIQGTDTYLRYMLRKRLQWIENDDKMIQSKGGADARSQDQLVEDCRERGMLGLRSVEEMRQQLRDWLDLSLNHSVPSSLMILSRATLFSLPVDIVEDSVSERQRKLEKEKEGESSSKDVAFEEMINAAAAYAQQQLCKVSEAIAILASASINLNRSMSDKKGTDGEQDMMKAYKEIDDSTDEHVSDGASSALINRVDDAVTQKLEKDIDAKVLDRGYDGIVTSAAYLKDDMAKEGIIELISKPSKDKARREVENTRPIGISESYLEKEEVHWRKRIEQRLMAQEDSVRHLHNRVGSLEETVKKLDTDAVSRLKKPSSPPIFQDDHFCGPELSSPLKKPAEDRNDFLGKITTGGSVANDQLTLDNISRTGTGTSSEKMETKCIGHDSLDAFNNIPSSIIEHILCFVPIKDAVRTSVLSRNWRYRWAKIPKLKFRLEKMVDEDQLEQQLFADWSFERKWLMMRCKGFFAVHQVLLMHKGPIREFSFKMFEPDDACVEIEQMIIHLARRTNGTVKKFTFKIISYSNDYIRYELPRSIFLLRNLTDLHIEGCILGQLVPTFDGFCSLTSLSFLRGSYSEKPLLHLLANCPLLKKLELLFEETSEGWTELHRINIIKLFKCLPVIEDLSISQWIFKDCKDVPRELPIALVHLKRFCFSSMMLLDGYGLEFVFLVIRSSPNLEKIELHIDNEGYIDCGMGKEYWYPFDALKDCADIWLEHLKELEIREFAKLKHEMKFVKLILERAPMLKKVRIFQRYHFNDIKRDRDLKTIRKVLHSLSRVSPLAEIFVLRK